MARTATADVLEMPARPSPGRPVVFFFGRQGSGKSTLAGWMMERAINQGRAVLAVDADRSRATLSRLTAPVLKDRGLERQVARMKYSDDAGVAELLDGSADRLMDDAESAMLIDASGGDMLIPHWAAERGIVQGLDGLGRRAVVVYMVGRTADDKADLAAVEDSGAFSAAATIVVLNAAQFPSSRAVDEAIERLGQDKRYNAIVARGGRTVVMPRLSCMDDLLATKLPLYEAASSPGRIGRLGLTRGGMVAMWLVKMEEAFAGAAEWLP